MNRYALYRFETLTKFWAHWWFLPADWSICLLFVTYWYTNFAHSRLYKSVYCSLLNSFGFNSLRGARVPNANFTPTGLETNQIHALIVHTHTTTIPIKYKYCFTYGRPYRISQNECQIRTFLSVPTQNLVPWTRYSTKQKLGFWCDCLSSFGQVTFFVLDTLAPTKTSAAFPTLQVC